MDIDAVIAEATKVAEPAQASEEASTNSNESKEVSEQEVTEAKPEEATEAKETDIGEKPDSELSPEQLAKREANRQSHFNSKLARMRRENRELKERVEQISKAQEKPQPKANEYPKSEDGSPIKPKESDYGTWGEFLDAKDSYYEELTDWKVTQKLSARETKQSEEAGNQEQQAQRAHRILEVAAQEQEFAKANPEYTALYNEYGDFMNNLPLPVGEALMDADNASLALYALMKEGNLESLEDMTPRKISMEIGKAEVRGQGYLKQQKQATSAPRPITPAKGNSVSGKSITSMGTDELLKWVKT